MPETATLTPSSAAGGSWRVLIAVPPAGFAGQFALMRAWLDGVCGPGGWWAAPAGTDGVVNDAVALHFADPGLARAFLGRFACGYRSLTRHGV